MTSTPRRGGALKPPAQRKRNNLTFRARDQLKADLVEAAQSNRRSLSEEIEFRLEQSFLAESYERRAKLASNLPLGAITGPGRFVSDDELKAGITRYVTTDELKAAASRFVTLEELKAELEPIRDMVADAMKTGRKKKKKSAA